MIVRMKGLSESKYSPRSLSRNGSAWATVLQYCRMGQTLTIRLTRQLAEWLERTAARTGCAQGQIVRDQLEKARTGGNGRAFMRLAGSVRGPKDLSARKGFSRS